MRPPIGPEFARECLLEAHHLYRHWGATEKLARLEREHGHWINSAAQRSSLPAAGTLATTTATQSLESTNLDVASALKATLAISGEVRPARLFAVLMQTIIENVGAEQGYLVTSGANEEDLRIAAKASVRDTEADAALSVPLEECATIARDMVRYVARTRETLVLDDAHADATYKNDSHIEKNAVKSALCMPILHQGRLLAVLYVENSAVARAFTAARLLFLRVIAGQAAVSIANAALYDHLEFEVAARTRELSERSREIGAMLNSLEQGVFTIDDQLTIQPRYSAHLPELLGTREIAGQNCVDLLFGESTLDSESLDKLRAALEFSFGVPIMFAEVNKAHWVREFQRNANGTDKPRHFEVDWTLIADDDDNVHRILVALRDVTLIRQMSAKAAQQARDLDFVGQILDAGVVQFQGFCTATREMLAEAEQLLANDAQATAATRQQIFRGLHTTKGNARLLGFQHLSNAVHLAEECFDARHADAPSRARHAQMCEAIDAVVESVAEYERVYHTKLADAVGEPERAEQRTFGAILSRVNDAKAGLMGPNEAIASIDDLLRRIGAVPLAQVVQHASRVLPLLAQELGKPAPFVEAEDHGVWLTAKWAETLRNSFVHTFQNSMVHGLEGAEDRRRDQKPERGKIRLRTVRTARGATLWLSDDGRGLNLAALRRMGRPEESDEQVAERIFESGVSTAEQVTNAAGRGVGLDAVRTFIRSLGGEISIALGGAARDGYRPFEFVLDLPPEATVTDPSRPSRPPPSSHGYASRSNFPADASARPSRASAK